MKIFAIKKTKTNAYSITYLYLLGCKFTLRKRKLEQAPSQKTVQQTTQKITPKAPPKPTEYDIYLYLKKYLQALDHNATCNQEERERERERERATQLHLAVVVPR